MQRKTKEELAGDPSRQSVMFGKSWDKTGRLATREVALPREAVLSDVQTSTARAKF